MVRALKILLFISFILAGGAYLYAEKRWSDASLPRDFWAEYTVAQVDFDSHGIPTIEAETWEQLAEAQGYVVASERFFHMDLLRRSAQGGLSGVFGEVLLWWDRPKREEDWLGTADRAYEALPPKQKAWIDAYTRGVNAFLDAHPDRVGVEYSILGIPALPWKGRDTISVLLMMTAQLSKAAEEEAARSVWKDELPKEWFDFVFTDDHPLNRPLFSDPRPGPALPRTKLPRRPLDPQELAGKASTATEVLAVAPAEPSLAGAGASNSWAWCGDGKCFLANDPHLQASVPHIWYALRMRRTERDWVVGVSIPGIPGVTLGMNPYLAWAFTNTGEDVDDFIEERLSEDGTKYLASVDETGAETWRPVEVRTFEIPVRDGPSVTVEGRFTHRGPLASRAHLDPDKQYSRMWLPFLPEMLRLPVALNQAKSWEEVNAALDEMRAPAQNVVMVDHRGNIGYRTSGTGIDRVVSGRTPQPAEPGTWRGLEPATERRRVLFGPTDETRSATVARFLATANERLWVDEYGHRWAEDLRADRIREVLAGLESATHEDMTALQLDTVSRYHRDVLRWVAEHATAKDEAEERVLATWREWTGESEGHPMTIAQARWVEARILRAAVERVRAAFLGGRAEALPYVARQESAWMIVAMTSKGGFEVFGFDEAELASGLLTGVVKARLPPHARANRWMAQHAFVGNVPLIGDRFAVPSLPQPGHKDVPRVESPKYGASCRLVWDLRDPLQSTWALPVGQSGHASSPHFADLAADFNAGRTYRVFDDTRTWWVAPRGAALRAEPAR